MTLEHLEGRIVMNGDVTVTFGQPINAPGVLAITGDTNNDNFVVTEAANGMVTVSPGPIKIVPGLGGGNVLITPSTINTTATPVTFGPVSTIVMTLPGTTNYDVVALNGPGKTVPTTIGTVAINPTSVNLTFSANGVDNSGNLTMSVNDALAPPAMDGGLTASVINSSFAGISITQTGCCPAVVTLTNDTAPSTVLVSEGNADGDQITLTNDAFGPTTLVQHNGGPTIYHGNNDSISVTNSSVVNLRAIQNATSPTDGASNTININGLTVALASFGVITSQGNGAGDVTKINAVTTQSAPNPNLPLPGPASVPSISATQGSGSGDTATVSNSSLPGNITVTQNDVGGSKVVGDTATVSNDTVGFVQFFNGLPFQGFFGNITVHQGTAAGDVATVSGSTAVGNISISQLSGNGDSATISGGGPDGVIETGQPVPGVSYGGNLSISQTTGMNDKATITGTATTPLVAVGNVTITQQDPIGNTTTPGDVALVAFVNAGFTVAAPPFVFDYNGLVTISQGNGYNDEAILQGNGNTANNVNISQLDNVFTPGCIPGLPDVAQINGYHITSDINISQGDGNAVGPYVTAIAFDYLDYIGGSTVNSQSVTSGGDTAVTQNGTGNMVFMGDPGGGFYGPEAPAGFSTLYLDVFTGLGGANVFAANTTVLFGSLLGLYTIDGNDITGMNTFFDLGGNTGITMDPVTYNYVLLI